MNMLNKIGTFHALLDIIH